MRRIWLQKPNTNEIWDLLPKNSLDKNNASPFLGIKGMGYRQDVTQTQVNTEYYVSKVLSKNQSITGTMYFQDDEHIKSFQDFVGDFRQQLNLYYSPSGEIEEGDQLSAPYYKKVIITIVEKTEKDETGWYLCPMTISTQDDLWNRDLYYKVEGLSSVGNALVYPYTYPYELGGRNTLKVEFNNDGREVGCIVKIKNNSSSNLSNIEWFTDRTYQDYYGVIHENEDVQRSKWLIDLPPSSELTVDSNPLTQEAKVTLSDGTSQSVVDMQEPSYDYINFVQVPQGQSRIVFYIENENVDITFIFREQKELI